MRSLALLLIACAAVYGWHDDLTSAQLALLAAIACAVLSLREPRSGWLSRTWHDELDKQQRSNGEDAR